jgi:ATP-dependent RNA helicase DOB1
MCTHSVIGSWISWSLGDAGIVILMLDSKMEPSVAKDMLKGAPDTLHSEFRLGYSMLLNLMRGEGRISAPDLLAASFKQFQVEQALPTLRRKIEGLQV